VTFLDLAEGAIARPSFITVTRRRARAVFNRRFRGGRKSRASLSAGKAIARRPSIASRARTRAARQSDLRERVVVPHDAGDAIGRRAAPPLPRVQPRKKNITASVSVTCVLVLLSRCCRYRQS